jgi:photosystem II stability/assembly factor-like uncharacterized protein
MAAVAVTCQPSAVGAQVDARLLSGLRWRMIGPFRGGRTVAAVGVPGQPNTFYIGVNNGGVWKTTDAGRFWTPVFDDQPTGSIGAIAVAPSDPNIVYVGSGEGLQRPDLSVGDGIYKSIDAGRTWQHLGLRDGQQIAQIAVDPRDPNRVFAAVLGHPYGANDERGVYRSLDGGATWQQVLFKDANTGAFDVVFDPANAQHVYAVLWAGRQAPWEAGWILSANNGLYHSTDGGTTWQPLGSGLPSAANGLGRIGLGVSPSEPSRMYAVVGAARGGGLYRSDDAGASWRVVNSDNRLWGRDGDFNEVKVDPRNADVLYVANVASWKSTDGGAHFTGFRGAPGGDDYHRFWISPDDSKVILLSSDQGAVVTVNGGETWSSWYNQPTAQFYHVITDNAFPYRVYGGQQESGSAGVLSRGDDGQITFREWHPVGAEEYGYIAPDPLHPNLVYGGKLSRFDWNTGEVKHIAPEAVRSGQFRFVRTMPLIFSPVDPRILYYAGNVLFKTLDGGESWSVISPDLTREHYEVPANLGDFAALDPEHGAHRGVIYSIAPSFRRVNLIWVGTDDGLIHVTHDGGLHWRDVTPPQLTPYSKVSLMVASHFDTLVAYAAVNRFRLDDVRPHLYRTRDGGASWDEIVTGIPDNEVVNAVREDATRPGLLFAGSERAVYLSLDDGEHWQSLRLNMPATSIRDVWIHDNDLVAGTHGRSFWILDDFARLRQMAPSGADARSSRLFRPSAAYRVRWNRNTDTPIPFDEPMAENPPDGAIIDYVVGELESSRVGVAVRLEILDRAGNLVRQWASNDPAEPVDSGANIPLWWVRPEQRVQATPGAHRLVWDLRYPPPPALNHEYPISAIYRNTPREPRGSWVMPGRYTVKLTVGGRTFSESLTVRMDPRVRATPLALTAQFRASRRVVAAMNRDAAGLTDLADLRARLVAPQTDSAAAVQRELARINGQLAALLEVVDGADQAPTTQAARAIGTLETALAATLVRVAALKR